MLNITIPFFVCSVIFFLISIIVGIFNYHQRFKLDYHLTSHFPFELNYESKFRDNLVGNIILIISLLLNLVFLIFFNPTFVNGFLIFALIVGISYLVVIFFLFFVPMKLLKLHMFLDTLLFTLSIMLPGAIVGAGYIYYRPFKEPYYIVIMVLAVVLLLFAFIVSMNPKLKHWEQLEARSNDKGEVEMVRPKFFVLAFTEYLLIGHFFMCEILLLIINIMV